MAQQTIGIGTVADDGTGDDLRTAGDKINDNFTELYAAISALGGAWKTPVLAATTGAITLATDVENGDTLDGVVLATGDRILVKDQASASENGIYDVAASGAPTRASDADDSADLPGAVVLVKEGTANADTMWRCTADDGVVIDTDALDWEEVAAGTAYAGGKQSIPIMASAMKPRTTSGAAAGSAETTTNKIMLETLDFDAATDEFAQFMVPMPKSWNEGTISFKVLWLTAATSGNVVWGLQAVAMGDDDPLDAAFGTAVTVTDGASAAAEDLLITAESGAVTIAGTPAEGDLVAFQIFRDADNGSDTMSGDAKLLGLMLFITTNAADDS